jgi:hypothetical protein
MYIIISDNNVNKKSYCADVVDYLYAALYEYRTINGRQATSHRPSPVGSTVSFLPFTLLPFAFYLLLFAFYLY